MKLKDQHSVLKLLKSFCGPFEAESRLHTLQQHDQ